MRTLKRTAFNLVEGFIVFVLTISIVFALLYMVPGRIGGNSSALNQTDEQIKALAARYGYSGNFLTDYGNFMKHSLSFDFGVSTAFHKSVKINSFLWRKMGISFSISGLAVLLSVFISIPVALLLARKPGKTVDGIGMFFVSIAIAVPGFIVGILLLILASKIGMPIVFEITDFESWIMPILALTFAPTAQKVVFMRAELIEAKNRQYIHFAKVKGASRRRIEYKHTLRISMFAIITFLPVSFLGAFVGSMIIESIYGIPGAGNLLSSGIQTKDIPVVQAVMTINILLSVVGFMLRDITYRIIDPRLN